MTSPPEEEGGESQKMTKDDMMTMSKISVSISNVHFFSHLLPSFGYVLLYQKMECILTLGVAERTRVAKCQFLYTEQIFPTKFYPKKST